MTPIEKVGTLTLLDCDGTLHLKDAVVGPVCNLTDHEAGRLGAALMDAAGSQMKTEVEIRNHASELGLQLAGASGSLKERLKEEIDTLFWVLGAEDPYSNVWESEGTVYAVGDGDVYSKTGHDDWAKCENSDELLISRAKAALDHALEKIAKLGVEVSGTEHAGPGWVPTTMLGSSDHAKFKMKER